MPTAPEVFSTMRVAPVARHEPRPSRRPARDRGRATPTTQIRGGEAAPDCGKQAQKCVSLFPLRETDSGVLWAGDYLGDPVWSGNREWLQESTLRSVASLSAALESLQRGSVEFEILLMAVPLNLRAVADACGSWNRLVQETSRSEPLSNWFALWWVSSNSSTGAFLAGRAVSIS